jgi:hypothetical protein
MMSNAKMAPYVIDKSTWNCVWDALIVKGMGLKTGEPSQVTVHALSFRHTYLI